MVYPQTRYIDITYHVSMSRGVPSIRINEMEHNGTMMKER